MYAFFIGALTVFGRMYHLKMIFSEPVNYLDSILLNIPPYQIVSRIMVVSLFIILGLVIIEFFIRKQVAEQDRKEAHETLLNVLNSG